MSAKILSMKRPTKDKKSAPAVGTLQHLGNLPDIDADYTTVVRAFINHVVREYVMTGGKMNRLALKANISSATVSRLAYYETTHPRWHTVMAVIIALEKFDDFAELTTRYANQHGRK